jgi:AcrR family transcriptional regulator
MARKTARKVPTQPRKIPTQPRARATVAAILDATELLARERGLESLTVREIVKRAGVSPGTLYQYFPTLEAILAAWEERGLEADAKRFFATVQDAAERALSADDRIALLVGCGFDLLLGRMSYYHDRSRGERVSRITARLVIADDVIDFVASLFANARERPRLRRTDHASAARLIVITGFMAAYHAWVTEGSEEATGRIRNELVAMIGSYVLLDP